MTRDQFKYLIEDETYLNTEARKVIINYNTLKIQDIAVRLEGNNLARLQQATNIILIAPQAGTSINISLQSTQIPVKTVNREKLQNYFLYSIVEENQQPEMSTPPTPTGDPLSIEEYFTDVIIIPTLELSAFEVSEYNILLNNSMNNRTSDYIQISDRQEISGSSTNPTNLSRILANTATLASIQDSNYSAKGWINGRYFGTTTSATTYGRVEPALTGRTFQGSFHSNSVRDSTIASQAASEKVFKEYLQTSILELPDYEEIQSDFINLNAVNNSQTTFTIKLIPLALQNNPLQFPFKIGDLIKGSGTYTQGPLTLPITELMRIEEIQTTATKGTYQIRVTRGWNGKTPQPIPTSRNILIITPGIVYEIDRVRPIYPQKGKLFVRESQKIIHLDEFGQIISSSL